MEEIAEALKAGKPAGQHMCLNEPVQPDNLHGLDNGYFLISVDTRWKQLAGRYDRGK